MNQRRAGRIARYGFGRVVLMLLCLISGAPLLTVRATQAAVRTENPLTRLVQPSVRDLETAFAMVGRGALPDGYPKDREGWVAPASLLKAIAWTESTWRQFVAPARPLVSWDGGYGLMQITTGMEPGQLPWSVRSAIAHNFLYNVAYGNLVLVKKWLQTPNIGNDDPAILEHWYYALWAYNGWGWVNNPNNPRFARIDTPATHPASFPYQERVLYWLAHPPRDRQGAPLWPPIAVSLPDPRDVGLTAHPLPEAAVPHEDVALPLSALSLGPPRDALLLDQLTSVPARGLTPGQVLRVQWTLRNTGSETWTTGWRWSATGGTITGIPTRLDVTETPPLGDVTLTTYMVAPARAGRYREYWQMQDPRGRRFGPRTVLEITVGPTKAQLLPTPTTTSSFVTAKNGPGQQRASALAATLHAPLAVTSTPGAEPNLVSGGTDLAVYDGDLSIPDGTVLAPGAHFIKSWRIMNVGTSTWSAAYHWHFEAGTLFGDVLSTSVPPTAPGASVDVSVPMVAPMQPGSYASFWQMTDTTGKPFPHQAWVRIVVRKQTGGIAKPRPRAPYAASATSTDTPTASPTAVPATATVEPATATQLQAEPTLAVPGGDGELIASPWIGAFRYHSYFPAGSTRAGWREAIALYYPGTGSAHVRVTMYRPDSAQRVLQFTLLGRSRRLLDLNRLVPGTGLAVAVESDRVLVTQRVTGSTLGLLGDPGAARSARSWIFPALPSGAPDDQQIVLFNPHDTAVTLSLKVLRVDGGCCVQASYIVVPPQSQYQYQLGTAVARRGPIVLFGNDVVVAERVAMNEDRTTLMGIPGTVLSSKTWYVPYVPVRTKAGSIIVFNPGSRAVSVQVRLALAEGAGTMSKRSVAPLSEVAFPLDTLTKADTVGAEVLATGPIVAGAAWQTLAGAALTLGTSSAGSGWSLLLGLGGPGTSEGVALLNPGSSPAAVTLQLSAAKSSVWHIVMPPGSRYLRMLTGLAGANGAALTIAASTAIVAERVISTEAADAASVGALVTSH